LDKKRMLFWGAPALALLGALVLAACTSSSPAAGHPTLIYFRSAT